MIRCYWRPWRRPAPVAIKPPVPVAPPVGPPRVVRRFRRARRAAGAMILVCTGAAAGLGFGPGFFDGLPLLDGPLVGGVDPGALVVAAPGSHGAGSFAAQSDSDRADIVLGVGAAGSITGLLDDVLLNAAGGTVSGEWTGEAVAVSEPPGWAVLLSVGAVGFVLWLLGQLNKSDKDHEI